MHGNQMVVLDEKVKPTKETIQLLWKYATKKKGQLCIVFLFSIISAALGVFTIFLLGDMMTVISNIAFANSSQAEINQLLAGSAKPGEPVPFIPISAFAGAETKFIWILCLAGGAYLIQYVLNTIQSRLLVNVAQGIGYFVRCDLFHKLQRLSSSYLDSQSTGNMMSVFTNDVDILVSTFSQSINGLVTGLSIVVGGLILLFVVNPVLAAIAVGLSAILFYFVTIFIKKSQPHFKKQQKMLGELSSEIQEYNFAHDMISLYGYEDEVIKDFDKKNQELRHATFKAQMISGLIFPYNNFINNFVIATITALIFVFQVYVPNIMTISGLAAGTQLPSIIVIFVMTLRQTTTQISQILSQINALQLTFAASARVQNIFKVKDENNKGRTKNLKVSKADIIFDNVCFSYIEGKPVLNNISFEAKPGTMNAIVGPTGSGKTTIISLLNAFYDIDSGSIKVDGQDLSHCKRSSIRNNVALVLQDSFMFNGTIAENIKYGRLDATKSEIIKAAKASGAHKFISRLPHGYETVISNNSDLLSEGEKQLISIARIFLSKAKIIILDEATSYVDTKTEKDIQAATRRLMKNRTSIVIAHRLSTIKDADNIIVIKDGIQIESGNHTTLMKNKQFYYKLNTALDGDFDTEANR